MLKINLEYYSSIGAGKLLIIVIFFSECLYYFFKYCKIDHFEIDLGNKTLL